MDLHGLVDPFWLWHYLLLAGAIGVALLLTVVVCLCARFRDRLLGSFVPAVVGLLMGIWGAVQVRRRTRPREGD